MEPLGFRAAAVAQEPDIQNHRTKLDQEPAKILVLSLVPAAETHQSLDGEKLPV